MGHPRDCRVGHPPDALDASEWDFLSRMFQKRHLLSHKMGVIDAEYVQRSNDPAAIAGRKIAVDLDEVLSSLLLVQRMGDRLYEGIVLRIVPPGP